MFAGERHGLGMVRRLGFEMVEMGAVCGGDLRARQVVDLGLFDLVAGMRDVKALLMVVWFG